ncbi:DUF5958 family protein [Streptomyces kronopolitis]
MCEREVVVNELAQGLRPMAEGMAWFAGCPEVEQRLVVRELVHFCIQARATEGDAQEAIARSGLRPTYTPAVMLTRCAAPVAVGRPHVWSIESHAGDEGHEAGEEAADRGQRHEGGLAIREQP